MTDTVVPAQSAEDLERTLEQLAKDRNNVERSLKDLEVKERQALSTPRPRGSVWGRTGTGAPSDRARRGARANRFGGPVFSRAMAATKRQAESNLESDVHPPSSQRRRLGSSVVSETKPIEPMVEDEPAQAEQTEQMDQTDQSVLSHYGLRSNIAPYQSQPRISSVVSRRLQDRDPESERRERHDTEMPPKQKEQVARNKRMFGVLLGTLQEFSKERDANADLMARREQLEEEVNKKVQHDHQVLIEAELAKIRQEKEKELAVAEELREKEERLSTQLLEMKWSKQKQLLSRFIKTTVQPCIYYLPKKPLPNPPQAEGTNKVDVSMPDASVGASATASQLPAEAASQEHRGRRSRSRSASSRSSSSSRSRSRSKSGSRSPTRKPQEAAAAPEPSTQSSSSEPVPQQQHQQPAATTETKPTDTAPPEQPQDVPKAAGDKVT